MFRKWYEKHCTLHNLKKIEFYQSFKNPVVEEQSLSHKVKVKESHVAVDSTHLILSANESAHMRDTREDPAKGIIMSFFMLKSVGLEASG